MGEKPTTLSVTEEHGPAIEVEQKDSEPQPYDNVSLPSYLDDSHNGQIYRRMSLNVTNLIDLTHEAKEAVAAERAMSLKDALRQWPKAVAFSAILSLALVMEGYDTALLGSFYALPAFRERFGKRLADGSYQITAAWMTGFSNASTCGSILGLLGSGIVCDRYGYRKTMIGALLLMILFIFPLFFAQSLQMLLCGEILCGVAWGVFQTNTVSYASEVTPVALRAYMTSYVNLCWVMGQFISAGVVRGMLVKQSESELSFRLPFALQWIWPLPIIVGVLLAPESPWWLVRKGRVDDAKKSMLRLVSPKNTNFNVDRSIALMVHTNELEKSIDAGTSYLDLFKGTDLRRTEIVCCVWMIQVLCGIQLVGSGAYFFLQAGFSADDAFSLNIGLPGLGFLGCIVSWFLMQSVGRRTLYVYGLGAMVIVLMAVGFLAIPPESPNLSWATGGLVYAFAFLYDLTVGPACYSLVSEIPSTRLRIKSVVLARCSYNIAGIISNIITPRLLNPSSSWYLRGKSGFVFAGFAFISFVWSYFRLPEPKVSNTALVLLGFLLTTRQGLTYCELDILFENKANARKFRQFRVVLEDSGYFSVVTTPG